MPEVEEGRTVASVACRTVWGLCAGLAAAVVTFVAVAIWSSWPWIERAVAVEDAPTAWLSSSLLCFSAALACALALSRRNQAGGWTLTAVALVAGALDEQFMGHERLKELILFRLFDGRTADMGVVGDLPMLVYPLAGALVVLHVWRAGAGGPVRGLLVGAVTVGAVAIIIDIATDSLAWQVVEDALELCAETAFACALLHLVAERSA